MRPLEWSLHIISLTPTPTKPLYPVATPHFWPLLRKGPHDQTWGNSICMCSFIQSALPLTHLATSQLHPTLLDLLQWRKNFVRHGPCTRPGTRASPVSLHWIFKHVRLLALRLSNWLQVCQLIRLRSWASNPTLLSTNHSTVYWVDCYETSPTTSFWTKEWNLCSRQEMGVFLAKEAPVLWPPDAKSQLFRKDPDSGKDWGQEEKQVTKDEMVITLMTYHITDSMDMRFEQTLGDSEGQGSLMYCSPWGHKESDTSEQLILFTPVFHPIYVPYSLHPFICS